MATTLDWKLLPELPPHRDPKTVMRPGGRLVTSLASDRLMVKLSDGEQHQALFHHNTKTFWTLGMKPDRRLDDVAAWAFEPRPDAA